MLQSAYKAWGWICTPSLLEHLSITMFQGPLILLRENAFNGFTTRSKEIFVWWGLKQRSGEKICCLTCNVSKLYKKSTELWRTKRNWARDALLGRDWVITALHQFGFHPSRSTTDQMRSNGLHYHFRCEALYGRTKAKLCKSLYITIMSYGAET